MENFDELKVKFWDLIQRNNKIPVVGGVPDYGRPRFESWAVEESSVEEAPSGGLSDQDILNAVDERHYTQDGEYDAGRYELERLDNFEQAEDLLFQLRRQQAVVSGKVLLMIREQQSACQLEFGNVEVVRGLVHAALTMVTECRCKLELASRHFTTTSLGLLANYRRRILVQRLSRYLRTIKMMHEMESRMPELFDSGEYSEAIKLLLECQRVAARYKHLTCVDSLSGKLQDTLVMAEEHLDGSLATMCLEFDGSVYGELQLAYSLLGKTEVAIDQLHMHFKAAVQRESSHVVQSYSVVEASGHAADKKTYSQWCEDVSEDHFVACLLTLCKVLWKIVLSYHRVVSWHSRTPAPTHFEAKREQKKLTNWLETLWKDVQSKVTCLVLAVNLSNYKIDDFLEVLSVLHRFSLVGEEFCDSGSKDLADSIKTQSICYFDKFHADKLDDLKVFLENEVWTSCPVRWDFSCLHLQEFVGLRSSVENCAGVDGTLNARSLDGSSTGGSFFRSFPDPKGATPFDESFHPDSRDEHIMSELWSANESDEEELDDGPLSGSDDNRKRRQRCSAVTNTTLSVLRLCGKYLQLSRLLSSISVEVVSVLTQLFEYYLYAVYSFFATDSANCLFDPTASTLKLSSIVKRVHESLFSTKSIDEARVSPMISLTTADNLFGLQEREIAVESLEFLAKQFNFLKPYLEQRLESQGSSILCLQQFYSQTVSVALEMRKPIYSCIAWRVVDSKKILAMMYKVDWEVKEVMSEHNKYVDVIIEELQLFKSRLSRVHMLKTSLNPLWECVLLFVAQLFVEGFAGSRKCSSAGRGLMLLDFAQYVSKLDKMTPLRPVPYCDLVETYVKAYYQREEELESWIKEHDEYSTKQLLALVSCAFQTNRKIKQKLTAVVEELARNSVR